MHVHLSSSTHPKLPTDAAKQHKGRQLDQHMMNVREEVELFNGRGCLRLVWAPAQHGKARFGHDTIQWLTWHSVPPKR